MKQAPTFSVYFFVAQQQMQIVFNFFSFQISSGFKFIQFSNFSSFHGWTPAFASEMQHKWNDRLFKLSPPHLNTGCIFFYRQPGCLAFSLKFGPKIKQFLSNFPSSDWVFFFRNSWFLRNRVKINFKTKQLLSNI